MANARFLGSKPVNGHEVGFYSPPHGEPDFVWADLQQLASAFLPGEAAARMVQHTHKFDLVKRPVETVAHDGRIVTIVPGVMAHGFCNFIDAQNGHVQLTKEDWNNGPAAMAYIVASADAQIDFLPLGWDGIARAFNNQGGPYMRGMRDA